MLELNLFREKFRDFGDDAYRLLFERGDVTLYAWIIKSKKVKAFQINFREELFYHFSSGGKARISGISDSFLLRSLQNQVSEEQKKVILSLVTNVTCAGFENLFSQIRRTAEDRTFDKLILNEKEMSEIANIRSVDCTYKHESN